jgi:hypothetical protein
MLTQLTYPLTCCLKATIMIIRIVPWRANWTGSVSRRGDNLLISPSSALDPQLQ